MQLKNQKKNKPNTLKGNKGNELIKIKAEISKLGRKKKKQENYSTTNRSKSWILGRKKQKARAKTR